jgi:hypothetical protein
MNEITIKSQNDEKKELIDILKGQRTSQKLFHYLTTKDVHNLMRANKEIYKTLKNPKTYIYDKYMFKKYKDNYLFFLQNNIQIRKLRKILEVISYSDDKYKALYKITDTLVIIYYFAGCILLLDVFVLFVMIDKSVNHFDDFLPQIPLVIFWVLSIAILVSILILERVTVNKIKKTFREKNIVKEGDIIEKKILSNISKRLCNKKPISYRTISFTYILCFIPVLYKYLFSTKYSTIFLYVSGLFSILGFIYDFSNFFYYKYTHNISNIHNYQEIYYKLNRNYEFDTKLRNIKSYYPHWNLSEIRLAFQFYFWLAAFHGVIMLYSYLIGKKLDNQNFGVSWRVLLIPLYIACFIIVLWGIIYIYSIKQYQTKYKWILVTTIIIIMVCTIVNCVFWPNFYVKNKSITKYFPIVIDGIITLITMIHVFFLYKTREEEKNSIQEI